MRSGVAWSRCSDGPRLCKTQSPGIILRVSKPMSVDAHQVYAAVACCVRMRTFELGFLTVNTMDANPCPLREKGCIVPGRSRELLRWLM